MPQARKSLISLADTPYYHCVSRCVRRAWLCGQDKVSGQCYEHRRLWVEKRIHLLAQVFAIEVCAYAVMSNHTHVVLHVEQSRAANWTIDEVIHRWHQLYKGTVLSRQYQKGQSMTAFEVRVVEQTAQIWRYRLMDISWFMRSLNEYIAREANKEDECTGRFWEGRFKSQALLDEAALAACMVYVDLNPVRSGLARTPETSDHTSIQHRMTAAKTGTQPHSLKPLLGVNRSSNHRESLPFQLSDYIDLVSLSGKALVNDNPDDISVVHSPILRRLDLKPRQWQELTRAFEASFHHAAGNEAHLEHYTQRRHKQRVRDRQSAKRLFGK